jgi:hypothetical protein
MHSSREAARLRAGLAARAKSEIGQELTTVEFAQATGLPLAYVVAAARRYSHPLPLDTGGRVRFPEGLKWLDGEALRASVSGDR